MTVHLSPKGSDGLTPCCGRSPFDLMSTDQLTLDPDLVTCRKAMLSGHLYNQFVQMGLIPPGMEHRVNRAIVTLAPKEPARLTLELYLHGAWGTETRHYEVHEVTDGD